MDIETDKSILPPRLRPAPSAGVADAVLVKREARAGPGSRNSERPPSARATNIFENIRWPEDIRCQRLTIYLVNLERLLRNTSTTVVGGSRDTSVRDYLAAIRRGSTRGTNVPMASCGVDVV